MTGEIISIGVYVLMISHRRKRMIGQKTYLKKSWPKISQIC